MNNDTIPYHSNPLKLEGFKQAYKQTTGLPIWIRHLILGLLVSLETYWIDYKTNQTITDAITEYNSQAATEDLPHWLNDAKLTITENPNSTHKLPTLTISAPFSKGFPDDGNNNL
jgi:hypothetical protein